MSQTMTERQKREKEYYDQYAVQNDITTKTIDLSPVLEPLENNVTRPWNSYWAIYAYAINEYHHKAKLLDFGSGPGDNALRFATIGYEVKGFDISEKNVKAANKVFEKHNMKGEFKVSFAEDLPYANETFDLIVGIDILHHVDIAQSIKECYRVLKPGAKAYFREPVEVPFLDWIRNTALVRYFAPKEASLENHITEDERKLNIDDEIILKTQFPKLKKHYFFLFSRFDKFYRDGDNPRSSLLEKLDYYLMKTFPLVKKLGGTIIYELQK